MGVTIGGYFFHDTWSKKILELLQFSPKKCPEAFNLKCNDSKTGVPLGNLRHYVFHVIVFYTSALKRKAVEHPATEYWQCVWLFFLRKCVFSSNTQQVEPTCKVYILRILYIHPYVYIYNIYVLNTMYIYIHKKCIYDLYIYIYMQFTNTPKPSSKNKKHHVNVSFVCFVSSAPRWQKS